MPREPGRPYREEDPSGGPSGHHRQDHGHGDLEEAAFDLFRRILFPESHEHHPGEHHTEYLAELLKLLDSRGHSREFEEVLKEVEFYHPGIIDHLKHDDGHDYVQGLYRRHTEEPFDPSEWELDSGVGGEAATHWWDNTHSHEDHPLSDRPEYHSWDHRAEDHYWWHEKEGHPWEDHGQHWSHPREDNHWLPSAEDHPWHQAHDQRYDRPSSEAMPFRSVGVVEDEGKKARVNSRITAYDDNNQKRNSPGLPRTASTVANTNRISSLDMVNSPRVTMKQSTVVVFIAIVRL